MAYQDPNSMRAMRTPTTVAPATGEAPVIAALRRNKAAATSGEVQMGDWSQGMQVPAEAAKIPTVPVQPARPGIPDITSPTPKPASEIFSTLGPALAGPTGPIPTGVKSDAELLSLRDRQMPSYMTQAAEKAPAVQTVSLGLPAVNPPVNGVSAFTNPPVTPATPVPTPATDIEAANAKKGLSVDMQRGAVNVDPETMRLSTVNPLAGRPDGFGQGSVNTGAGNTNLQNSLRGMAPNQAYQVNTDARDGGTGSKIYATKDANGRLSLTGTGVSPDAPGTPYEQSTQFKQGMQRYAQMKSDLGQIEEGHKEQDLQDAVRNSSIGQLKANKQNLANYEARKTVNDTLGKDREVASLRLRAEQFNKDREYGLQQKKFELDSNKDATEQHDKSMANMNEQLKTMFVDKDGKPDMAKVSDASAKINETIGAHIDKLQKVPKGSENYAEAQKLADKLSKYGLAALDDGDRKRMLSQLATRDRIRDSHGPFTPGGSEFVDSELGGYEPVGAESNMIGSDTIQYANGARARANDTRYADGRANSFLPDIGKVPTDRFTTNGFRRGQK